MKISKRFFGVATCFLLLLLAPVKNDSFAACPASPEGDLVKIAGYAYTAPTIQAAYDHASKPVIDGGMGLPEFTLQLVAGIFTEDVVIDGGAVEFDGGYDCSFATTVSSSSILGTITIKSSGALVSTVNTESPKVVSIAQCAFDRDGDGFTSIGSCSGSADDCDDDNPDVYPGAVELCDGLDNDCNGQIDDGTSPVDVDSDGYSAIGSCGSSDDCNDSNAGINPGAEDIPFDGVDQDCSGSDLTFAGESCVDCHDPASNWTNIHDLTTPPDGTCAGCHAVYVNNILSGHYGDTVRTASPSNNITLPATIVCVSCHDPDAANHSGGIALGTGTNTVGSKIASDFPNITCDTCHGPNRASLHATATAHNNRIIDSSCANCHTSDTTVLGNPGSGTLTSAADVDALHGVQQVTDCALCHAYSGTLLNKANVLSTIQQGLNGTQVSCLNCHTDKGANHGNFEHPVSVGPNDLSYDAPGQPCSDCHVVANWTEIEGTEHNVDTNGVGSCATCHNSSRQEVIDAIALAADPTNCLDCHSNKNLTVHGSVDHVSTTYVTGGATFCLDCHDPGGAANATVDVTHGGDCTLCHTTVPALQPGVPVDGGDCVTCHTVTWQVLHMNNPPDHSALVTTSSTNNCASCHADALVDASTHLADCSNCHDASDGSLVTTHDTDMQTFAAGGNCETCHADTWQVLHLTNTPDHGFLVRVDATSCADCHSDPPPLVDSHHTNDPKVHDACASCHNTNGSLVTLYDTNLQTFVAGGDCTTCHTTGFDTIHAISHTHTVAQGAGDLSFDAPGTPCSDCHVVATWVEIEGTEHNVATNGAGSCSTCHNSPRQEVIDAIALGADPTNCLDCHSNKNLTVHGSIDHVASTDVTLAAACDDCHDDSGQGANWTVDITHGADCTLCHTTVPALQPGVPAGPADCATCHSAAWNVTHTAVTPDHSALVNTTDTDNCVSCHADALIDASTHLSNCSNCHNGDGSLVTTFGTNNQTFAAGGNCETCHTLGWESTHFDNNNGTTTHNTLVQVDTTTCGSCHSDPPPLTDNADAKVHSACGTCHTANGSLHIPLVGLNFITGGDCTTCHGTDWGALHPTTPDHSSLVTTTGTDNCASCHADALIDASTHLSNCSNCHNGDGSLVTTYNTNLQTFAGGGNCETCHTLGWESTHFDNNNGTTTHNTLVQVDTTTCGSCHVDPPPLTDNADAKVHSACSNCHTANGSLHIPLVGLNFITGGDCTTCHGTDWGALHPTTPDHSSLVTTTGTDNCASCHADALIDASTHLSNCSNCHNGDGSLVTTYNTNLQTFAGGGNCETCHTLGWESTHFDNNNGTTTHNTLVQVDTTTCGSCHSDPPPLTDNADAKVHSACGTCHTANGSLHIPLVGLNFITGGDCTTCHGTDWGALHPTTPDHSSLVTTIGTDNCVSCHADALIDASTHLSNCSNCHNGDGSLVATNGTDLQTFAAGGNCETCHTDGWQSTHFDNNNDFTTHNTLVQIDTTSCGSCHNDPPPLTDAGDAKVHNACGSCHTANGTLQSSAVGKDFTTGGDCATCHTSPWNLIHNDHSHTVSLGAGDLSNGTSCGDCHVVANWSEINGTEHNVATNGPSSCETCHNSPRQEVIDAIALGANPTNCLDCHSDKTGGHGSIDHVAATYVTVGGTQDYYGTTCASCHDPGGAANATVDVTHSGNCNLCHTTVPNLQPGVPTGGGNCVDCHSTSEHTLWGRYMDTCSSTGCHVTFDGGPGNNLHDSHNPAGGWAGRNSATSGLTYPYSSNPEMWINNWPLNPTCGTCHTTETDDSSGAGCGACHDFPGKGDLHDFHAGKKAGEMDIDCAVCHWNS